MTVPHSWVQKYKIFIISCNKMSAEWIDYDVWRHSMDHWNLWRQTARHQTPYNSYLCKSTLLLSFLSNSAWCSWCSIIIPGAIEMLMLQTKSPVYGQALSEASFSLIKNLIKLFLTLIKHIIWEQYLIKDFDTNRQTLVFLSSFQTCILWRNLRTAQSATAT